MAYAIELLKTLKLSQWKIYLLVGALFALLLVENVFGFDVPLFNISDENVGVFILALITLLGVGTAATGAVGTANDNSLAAIAIAMNISVDELKSIIEQVKAYQDAIDSANRDK